MKSVYSSASLLFIMLMGLLQGCSVGLALDGADNPDLSIIHKGATQFQVELEIGKSVRWYPDEKKGQYHFTTGESGSAGRAVAHAAGDILTFGLWEIIGTPIEAVQSHDRWLVDIWYDEESFVVKWDGPRRR